MRRDERPLQRHLLRLLKSPTAAEDVLQNTFLLVHLRADQFDPARKVRPWLYAVASRQAIDYLRRNRRHQAVSLSRSEEDDENTLPADLVADGGPMPAEQVDAAVKRDWVLQAVRKLPQRFRQAFVRVHLEGSTYLDAAQELEVPVGTVKSRIHTAISRLVEAWQQRRRLPNERN